MEYAGHAFVEVGWCVFEERDRRYRIAVGLFRGLFHDFHEALLFPFVYHEILAPFRAEKYEFPDSYFRSFLENVLDFLVSVRHRLVETDFRVRIFGIFMLFGEREPDLFPGDFLYGVYILETVAVEERDEIPGFRTENPGELVDEGCFGDGHVFSKDAVSEEESLHIVWIYGVYCSLGEYIENGFFRK